MDHNLRDLGPVTILIADDNTVNRKVVSSAFAGYTVLQAVDGESALEILQVHNEVDVILMDVMMPGLNGYETCQIIKENPHWRFIPVIMLTSLNDVESRVEALQAGADDFISKPFSIVELRARVITSARAKRYYDQLENTENILVTLANVVENKDAYTNGHLQRIEKMTRLFCEKLLLSEQEEQIIRYGGLLHDIGKVAISDLILLKPGKLTPKEFETIKTHTIAGFNIVSSLKIGKLVGPIVRGHHERWNGMGYPDGLSGTDIPLGARIIGICDVFDALTTDRPYRAKMTDTDALLYIQSQAGIHFDPDLVPVFLELSQEF